MGALARGERQEQLALGEAPNIAARIQGLADPDSVIISDATHRLIQGFFDCHALGEHDLKGVADPTVIYQVSQASGAQSRLEAASASGLTPLVGREQEVGLLLERWEQCRAGRGQVVLLSGEAGIGKSRLVQVLKDHAANAPHTRMECRSSPYFTNSAFYPVIDMLQRTLRLQAGDTTEQKLEKLEQHLRQYRLPLAETVPLFGALLSLAATEGRYPALDLSPQLQRQKTLESILAIILELAERAPVLFILEDLHWGDPTTLELLNLLIEQTPMASLCLVLTCRPEFQPAWSHRSYLTEMTLNRISGSQMASIATQVAGGKSLPDEVISQLAERTDGVPLFVEEMTKSVLESGLLKESDGRYELTGSITSLSIPTTLQDSLMARLDRLTTAKAVAQYASVIGRRFSFELLQAVSGFSETRLQNELARLVEAELLYQRGIIPQATYTFKHALIQDVAYESQLRRTRQEYHQHIAQVLEERYPETAETQPELLAHHYTEAGLSEEAIAYCQQAGQRCSQQSANEEAVAYLTQGLETLKALPDTPRRRSTEFKLLSTLRAPIAVIKGLASPEHEAVNGRLFELSQQEGDLDQRFEMLIGLSRFYTNRDELHTAQQLGNQLLTLAQDANDPARLVLAHVVLGSVLLWLGEFVSSSIHIELAMALYDPVRHRSYLFQYGGAPDVLCRQYEALSLSLRGWPGQALSRCHEAIHLAQDIGHAWSLVFVLHQSARFHQCRREGQATLERANEAIQHITQHGAMPQGMAMSTIFRGWAVADQGHLQEGLSLLHQGIDAYLASGARLLRLYALGLLAEIYGRAGESEKALQVINDALATMRQDGARWWAAELYRLKGELLLQQDFSELEEAENCFDQALIISRAQQAKSLELRAATSLAKLWQSQGKRQQTYALLAPIYNWFTEGFDTADLIAAKVLLDELSEGSQ